MRVTLSFGQYPDLGRDTRTWVPWPSELDLLACRFRLWLHRSFTPEPLAWSAARPMGHGPGRFLYAGPTRRFTACARSGAWRGISALWGRERGPPWTTIGASGESRAASRSRKVPDRNEGRRHDFDPEPAASWRSLAGSLFLDGRFSRPVEAKSGYGAANFKIYAATTP